MRILITVFAILTLASCQEKAFEDKRPSDQIRFVNFTKQLRDTVNASESDKVMRNALLENGIPALKIYVKDTLSLAFNAWQAKVLNKTENYPNAGSVELKLGIAFDPADMTEKSKTQSIVFSSIIQQSNPALIQAIKPIQIGEFVKVRGEFIEKKGFIDIDSYSRYKFSKNIFDNPEFKTKLSAIEKL